MQTGAVLAAGLAAVSGPAAALTLADLRNGEDAPPITVCEEVPAP